MFEAQLFERAQRGLSQDEWEVWEIPQGTTRRGDRIISSAEREHPLPIPAEGRLKLKLGDEEVLSAEYVLRGPQVRSSVALPRGLCRLAPKTPEEVAAEFAGYDALPNEYWHQIGPSTGAHVVQLRLVKIPPNDIYRDFGSGVYYVYAIQRFVIQSAPC